MTSWQKVVLRGAIGIVVFDTVVSFASKTLGFSYGSAGFGSFIIYFAVGYFAARATGLIRMATLAGAVTGLVDATIGWWISWMIGPGAMPATEPDGLRTAGIVLAAIWVTGGAALTGMIGGLFGRRRAAAAVPAMLAALVMAGCGEKQTPEAAPVSPTVALMDAPDQSFPRGDVTINYRAIGAGDPIVLIHGYGDDLRMWAGLADSLARDHRVLALDTRAFGKSSKPAGAHNYGKAMSADVVALLDHEGIAQSHVVGFSMGAIIAADLALTYPARVRTVTLIAGAYPADSATMRALVGPWIADVQQGQRLVRLLDDVVPVLSDSQAREFSDMMFAASDSAALQSALEGFPALTVDWARVEASTVPALVLVGADDPLRRFAPPLAARWKGAKLVELPATDHMTIMPSPRILQEVRALIGGPPRVSLNDTNPAGITPATPGAP